MPWTSTTALFGSNHDMWSSGCRTSLLDMKSWLRQRPILRDLSGIEFLHLHNMAPGLQRVAALNHIGELDARMHRLATKGLPVK